MRGILASGVLLLPIVVAIGLAGGFAPLWDTTYPWQCTRLCNDDFWQAATLEDVRAELEDGEDVNRIRATDGNSPLHLAVGGPTVPEIVKLLLEAGADPNASAFRDLDDDPYRRELAVRTPLQVATEFREHPPEVIRLLLEYGADPNPPINPDSSLLRSLSPLTYSLWGNRRHRNEIVELLLRYGADPIALGWWNYEDKGATALHVAASVGDPDLLEVFLRYGAYFHVRTDSRSYHFEYADGTFLQGYYSAYPDGTLLHSAAKSNLQPESIEFLIEQGIDVNAETIDGQTPLHLASYFNTNSGVVQVLLEHGADPNARSDWGGAPLLWAIDGYPCKDALHCLRVVSLLLESGSDPNSRAELNYTPLQLSMRHALDGRVARLLVNAGAEVDAERYPWLVGG